MKPIAKKSAAAKSATAAKKPVAKSAARAAAAFAGVPKAFSGRPPRVIATAPKLLGGGKVFSPAVTTKKVPKSISTEPKHSPGINYRMSPETAKIRARIQPFLQGEVPKELEPFAGWTEDPTDDEVEQLQKARKLFSEDLT